MTNLVFGGGQSVDEADTVVVPRAADDAARTEVKLATEADETVVFLVVMAIDEVQVEVDLAVDPSLVEETTALVAVDINEVDDADWWPSCLCYRRFYSCRRSYDQTWRWL